MLTSQFVTLVFLDPVFFQHPIFFILPLDLMAVSYSSTDSFLSSEFFIYCEIVFNGTVITVAFII